MIGSVLFINLMFIIGIFWFVNAKLSAANVVTQKEEWIVSSPADSEAEPVSEEIVTDNQTEDSLFKEEIRVLSEEENYKNIYKAIIPGIYEAEEGITFHFYDDGTYDGYYDAENVNVKNYNYDLKGEIGKESYIVISDPTFTKSVSYKVDFDMDGKIVLCYGNNKYVELGY